MYCGEGFFESVGGVVEVDEYCWFGFIGYELCVFGEVGVDFVVVCESFDDV